MREIVSDIFMWSRFSAPHSYNFNGYWVRDPSGNLCIDPVEPDMKILEELVASGITRIVITNRNHARAANLVKARTGARTTIHTEDAAYANAQGAELDDRLVSGAHVGPFTVIGVPGKSPGEIALHWPARRLLVVGDAVIGNPPGRCSMLPNRVIDNPEQARDSIRHLLDLDFVTLLVGDGDPILSDARDRLRELVDTFG